jgi:hypothetical protein
MCLGAIGAQLPAFAAALGSALSWLPAEAKSTLLAVAR